MHPLGPERATRFQIAGGYGTAIYKHQPVTLNTNGTITSAAAASDIFGVFLGCEYVDSNGKPTVSNFWPAAQAIASGTTVTAEPDEIFEVQADGTVAQTAIGDQADITNVGAGVTMTGLSSCTLASSLAGAGVQGQFRIVDIPVYQDNVAGDAYTIVRVQHARHQFRANKVAI
jgi:hypothetical protein